MTPAILKAPTNRLLAQKKPLKRKISARNESQSDKENILSMKLKLLVADDKAMEKKLDFLFKEHAARMMGINLENEAKAIELQRVTDCRGRTVQSE